MEKMPIVVLLLYSIPESIILISLSAAIYGYKVKDNLHRIVLLGITLALVTYVVRIMPVKFGLNTLIEIPLFIFLTSKYLRIPLVKSFFFIFSGLIAIILAESISLAGASYVFHFSAKDIFDNPWLRILVGWIHLGILLAITVVLVKKNLSAVSAITFFHPKSKSGKITLTLISLVILQAVLAGSLNLISLYKNLAIWPSIDNELFERVITFLLFTFPLFAIILVKKMFTLSEQEAIKETQEAFIDNINKLFTTIRSQRHDFIHHVQVIYSMLNNKENEEAIKYMNNLLDEIQSVSNVIKLKDPVLSALLNTKTAIAERLNIKINVTQQSPIQDLKLKPIEVVKILGNLIDNAIEAVANQPLESRYVAVRLKKFAFVYVFEVNNPGSLIPKSDFNNIFASGYSTKENHSGLGLAVTKDLVERIGGEISVKSSEQDGTTFSVIIPVK